MRFINEARNPLNWLGPSKDRDDPKTARLATPDPAWPCDDNQRLSSQEDIHLERDLTFILARLGGPRGRLIETLDRPV